MGEFRAQRLASRCISMPTPRSDADRAAIAWACEMTTLESAAESMSDRYVAWADFDAMLADMPGELARVAAHFGFEAEPATLHAITAGPIMSRYSKDPSYEYTPKLRKDLLAQEEQLQGHEIDAALAMLRSSAEKSPLLARALARAED